MGHLFRQIDDPNPNILKVMMQAKLAEFIAG